MNVSIEKIIAKIEEEIKQAKVSSTEDRMREKIYSIKTLCELVLDEQHMEDTPLHEGKGQNQSTYTNTFQDVQRKKLEMNNEANGDSLFDF